MGRLKALLILALAALILGWGISAPTGLTGKDEYLLGLRIPLEMMEKDAWWIPVIDGEPRLKKPPLLYWAGRASYETFGPSLTSGRGVTVVCALLLLFCTAWLGRRFGNSPGTAFMAAAVLLGTAGIASESRRLMLDVPVAAFSVAAFCCYLSWIDQRRWLPLLGTAGFLGAALLTKGPIALVACGSGLLALWLTRPETRWLILRRWLPHLLILILAFVLPVFWYYDVATHHAAQLAAAARDELEARQGGHLSADALIGLLTIALPWSLAALHALWKRRREPDMRFLGLWLLISLLPFLFITTFSRYLIASLVPLAVATAIALERGAPPAWTRRLGSLIPFLLCVALAGLLWRWQLGNWAWLAIGMIYFTITWWKRQPTVGHLLLSACLLWAVAWGSAFPALGVNAVPEDALTLAHERKVILFAGPQPALLPALEHRPLRQTSRLSAELLPTGTLISVRAEEAGEMQRQLDELKLKAVQRLEYASLTSAGSGARFAREGTTADDWRAAWEQRSPAPLLSRVRFYEVTP